MRDIFESLHCNNCHCALNIHSHFDDLELLFEAQKIEQNNENHFVVFSVVT